MNLNPPSFSSIIFYMNQWWCILRVLKDLEQAVLFTMDKFNWYRVYIQIPIPGSDIGNGMRKYIGIGLKFERISVLVQNNHDIGIGIYQLIVVWYQLKHLVLARKDFSFYIGMVMIHLDHIGIGIGIGMIRSDHIGISMVVSVEP